VPAKLNGRQPPQPPREPVFPAVSHAGYNPILREDAPVAGRARG
jgi:hypothetical protein